MEMKAIELIKSIRELNDDMVDAARNVSLDVDDDALVADLARWAAKRCGEDEADVLREVKAWAETDSLFPTLRDILEIGVECNEEHDNPPPPWKFRDFLGFRGMEERNEWYKKRVHITIHRGTKQIGGSITEINMGETNIVVDLGSQLPGSHGSLSDDEIVKEL
jgi:ribonuclease J